ncbi:MAG: trehalose-6-phosphate synthase [Candidatus Omnitrophica bacterium]|nr:trehalose-6-phosphate synthase [Candidatus Omnitrophota bacterium]
MEIYRLWWEEVARLLPVILVIWLICVLVIRWSIFASIVKMTEWIRRARRGEMTQQDSLPKGHLFAPLTREVTQMARSLTAARAAAGEEARLRNAAESRWTPERLKEHTKAVLHGRPLVVVANREPYLHTRQGRQIQCIVPASGLVTAVEPILRACGGTWIAHGSGDADVETADPQGRLKVPPEEPLYTLRRLWLTREEEEGYYYGFSNEGLWPLCHIAHTRPIFRAEDWVQYSRVNAKFAAATLEDLEGTESPCILVQDYHFALLPRLIKEKRPDAKIAFFWHIPWPNPEAFGICPWARELLHGMLGADLLGFHIQFHCNNFLDTVDRMLESRIDWERFAINRGGFTTWVKPFPISIAPEEPAADPAPSPGSTPSGREHLLKELGLTVQYLGIGVDRIDYTKGIAERFRAVERFLEKYPFFQGKFSLVEIAAPSRTLIKRYHDLGEELGAEAERINRRFQNHGWRPILFLKKHHSHEEISRFCRAADLCLVTSLHDGMNLVAKEFVAARNDNRGVLILSRFAGASRELPDSLLVNPYDIDQVAEAIHYALSMDPEEQQERMGRMRETIHEYNVYRWAANLVSELARIRPLPQEEPLSLRSPE